jgi:glycosyltransferase involved in cell wall biosynthesis
MYFSDVEELADKIAQLLENDSLRITLQKNARAFVESRYDWLKIASVMVKTYYRALHGTNCFGLG